MASEEDQPIYAFDDDEDDEDDSEPLNGAVPDDDVVVDSDSSSGDSAAVTVAIPSSSSISVAVPPPITPSNAVTVALPDPKRQLSCSPIVNPEKKPIDDSRRLFQRLWTDEDEIELLNGFLEYTANRSTTFSGHHHDTTAFYDQIKSKLQLEFNKNQLVEKLRRLKKKYRNVLSKMSSGKEFVFKSPHDQQTFEISRKIWTNLSPNFRGVAEFDDDDQNPNPNANQLALACATPPRPPNSSFVISHINLNSAAAAANSSTPVMVDQKPGSSGIYSINNNSVTPSNVVGFDVMMSNLNIPAGKLSSRKKPRIGKIDDKFVRPVNLGGNVGVEGMNVDENTNANNNNDNNVSNISTNSSNINLGSTMQGLIEEAVRSCLSPMVKQMVNNSMNGAVFGGSGGGIKGVGSLSLNAVPLSLSGVNVLGGSFGNVMDDKWRKQQILELEVYSKRLELVQDQIKMSLEELRSQGN
ncbi:unnamed protein product [Amaranthus hypochondriacus]